uniref:Uncharacterized protein n=1 Tax=Mycena chlorophos TaxID=658473 RepID=A0ABQ0M527_MYCCL|nr:predicted protein [Mycena chlorophos]
MSFAAFLPVHLNLGAAVEAGIASAVDTAIGTAGIAAGIASGGGLAPVASLGSAAGLAAGATQLASDVLASGAAVAAGAVASGAVGATLASEAAGAALAAGAAGAESVLDAGVAGATLAAGVAGTAIASAAALASEASSWISPAGVCDFLAIHPLTSGTNKAYVAAKHRAFLEDVIGTAVGKEHFRKVSQYVHTDAAHQIVTSLGFPRARGMLITHIVVDDVEKIKKVLCCVEIQSLMKAAKLNIPGYGQQTTMSTFHAKVQQGGAVVSSSEDCNTSFGVFPIPAGVPEALFEDKIRLLLDQALQIPIIKERTVNYTIWSLNDAVASEVAGKVAMPLAQRLIIVKHKFIGDISEILSHPAVKLLVQGTMLSGALPLGIAADFFVAAKAVLFEKK